MSQMDSDAYWILEVLSVLPSTDAKLARELLTHMAKLRAQADTVDFEHLFYGHQYLSLGLEDEENPDIELQLRRAAIYSGLREEWSRVKNLQPCLLQCQLLKKIAFFRIFS